jgi:hypothetical protein
MNIQALIKILDRDMTSEGITAADAQSLRDAEGLLYHWHALVTAELRRRQALATDEGSE